MRIEFWKHENVEADGAVYEGQGGAVEVAPFVHVSPHDLWASMGYGRDAETRSVSGCTMYFDSEDEMRSHVQIFAPYEDDEF